MFPKAKNFKIILKTSFMNKYYKNLNNKGASNNSYRFTNLNVWILVGGWVLRNQVFRFPVKKTIRTPRNTVFIHDIFKNSEGTLTGE